MLLRLLESIHGHLGVLAAVALVHPAILLRKGKPLSRGRRLAVLLSTAVTALAFGFGLAIYEEYRDTVKRRLLFAEPDVAMLFETKEHLAYATLTLALSAGFAALVAPREGTQVRRAAAVVYAAATVAAVITVCLGVYVASVDTFR
jgi:hypothetical protein